MHPVLLDAAATTRCRRRVHLDHDPAAGDPGPEGPVAPPEPDPGVEMRRADAAAHRVALAARWAATLGAGVVVVPPDVPRAERARRTREVLVPGGSPAPAVTHVLGAELPSGHGRRGSAELLVRAADGGWHPVVVVRHRITDPGEGALTSPVERPHPRRRGRVCPVDRSDRRLVMYPGRGGHHSWADWPLPPARRG